jgi:hypothetical protein
LQQITIKIVLLIEDCNTKPLGAGEASNSTTITNIVDGGLFSCISLSHDEYTTPDSEERYDHAFLSQSLFSEEYRKGSWDVRREVANTFLDEYKRDISNHVPVTLRVNDDDNDDNDDKLSGDFSD